MGVEEDKTGKGEAGNDTTVAKAPVVVSFAKERTAEELEGERKQWQAATLALLQELKIDASDQTWVTAIDTASEEFQELSQKSRGQRKQEALKWIANNPKSNLTTEAAPHLLALCAVKLTAREAEKLKTWTETSAPTEPAQPDEAAPDLATPATETGKTPEELAAERTKWKKLIQDFLDSVGLEDCPALGLSQQELDVAIPAFQKNNSEQRQSLVVAAEAWLAQHMNTLRSDLSPVRQQCIVALLTIDAPSLSQPQKSFLDKLRVALIVKDSYQPDLFKQQLDGIRSAYRPGLIEAIQVQLREDQDMLSQILREDLCEALTHWAVTDQAGMAGIPAVQALASVDSKYWFETVKYVERVANQAKRSDTALEALRVIASHEDSARWQRVVDIALDPSTQLGVRNKAVEYLVENKEWDMVKTFVERAGGRKELKTVVGFAQRSLEGAGVVTPSNAPEFVASDEEASPAAPASPAPELHSPPPEPPPSFDSDPTGFSVNYYGTIFNLDQGVRLGMLQDIPRLKADMTPEQVKSVLTTGKDPVPTPVTPVPTERSAPKAEGQAKLRPSEVADQLGVSGATLRRWTERFKTFLELPMEGGHQRYTEDDLAVLARVKTLLEQGWTYEQVNGELAKPESEDPVAEPAASATSETVDSLPGSRLQAAVGVLRELSQAENPEPLNPHELGIHLSALIAAMEVSPDNRGEIEALIEAYRKKVQPEAVTPAPEESTREKAVTRLTSFLIEVPEGSLPADPERARQVAEFFIDALGEENYPSQLFLDTLEGQDFATLGMTAEKYRAFFNQLTQFENSRPVMYKGIWEYFPQLTLRHLRDNLLVECLLLSEKDYLSAVEALASYALGSFFSDSDTTGRGIRVAEAVVDTLKETYAQSSSNPTVVLTEVQSVNHSHKGDFGNISLSRLSVDQKAWDILATKLSQLHPSGKVIDFTYTDSATFGNLREALVEQGFLDYQVATAEPLPAPEPTPPPPGSASEPGSETGAEFDEDFDAESVVIVLTRGEDSMFCEGKKLEDFDLNQMVFYVTYLATIGLFPEKELIGVRVDSYFTKNPTVNDTLKSFLESLYSPDADVEALIEQMIAVVQACLAGDESNHPVRFLDGKTAEMGKKRLAAVVRRLHEVIISRQQTKEPVTEPTKKAEFDARALAEVLVAERLTDGLESKNFIGPNEFRAIVSNAYWFVVVNGSEFFQAYGDFLGANLQLMRECRDMLYDPETDITNLINRLAEPITALIAQGKFGLVEGADWQTGHDRFAQLVTELHRILSERKSQAEPVPAMDLRGQPLQDTLSATELNDDIRRYLDRLAEREDGVAILNEIRDKAKSAEVRAYANQKLTLRVDQLPEVEQRSVGPVTKPTAREHQAMTDQPVESDFLAKEVAQLIASETLIPEIDRTNITESKLGALVFHASKTLVDDPAALTGAFVVQLRNNQKPFLALRDTLYTPNSTREQLTYAFEATIPWDSARTKMWLGDNGQFQRDSQDKIAAIKGKLNTRMVDLLVEINKILAERQKAKVGRPNKAKELLASAQRWGSRLLRKAQGAPVAGEPIATEDVAQPDLPPVPSPEAVPSVRQRVDAWLRFRPDTQAVQAIRRVPENWKMKIFGQSVKEAFDVDSILHMVDDGKDLPRTYVHYNDAEEGEVVTTVTKTSPQELASRQMDELKARFEKDVLALDEIEDILREPQSYGLNTEEGRRQAWEVVEDTFAEIAQTTKDQVSAVSERVAAQFTALMDHGVLPPEDESDQMPYEQALNQIMNFYNTHKDGQAVDVASARRTLFTFWRSVQSAPLSENDREATQQVDMYNGQLAYAIGYWAQAGWLQKM